MRKYLTAILALTLLTAGCGERPAPEPSESAMRIISMAPNVTEILYKLGLGDQLVGVSKFSDYPSEASKKPVIGGIYDPNWEMILSLQPDLVIGLDTQNDIAEQLNRLQIRFLGVPHERVEDILQSILLIGSACDRTNEAVRLFQHLKNITENTAGPNKNNPPGVLICIGHDDTLNRMYIAARNTFYDDLINLAGGTNVCTQEAIKYPEISPESLHMLNPDIVIDIVPPTKQTRQDIPALWAPYRTIVLTNQYSFIPGPRFVLLLSDLSDAIRQNDLKQAAHE